MMLGENGFKKRLIKKLNIINPGWIDGDKEQTSGKKSDVVNHSSKIAIEIKDDTKYKIKIPKDKRIGVWGEDLGLMNKRFTNHLRSANNKFKEYKKGGYFTIS